MTQRPDPPPTRTRVLAVLVLAVVLLTSWLLRGCAPDGTDEAEPGISPAATATDDAGSTPPVETQPDETRPEETRPEETRPDETQPTSDVEGVPQPGASGIPACDPAALPGEAEEVIDDIEAGGPFDYPRNDGVTFFNREGILPQEEQGYYREFTVETPGVDHRGARRIVTGGDSESDPEHWYYTEDHYESFCEFAP